MTKATTTSKPTLWGRYEKVIRVLIKYGFADVVAHPPFNRFLSGLGRFAPQHEGSPVTQFSKYERIRMVCEELGTTFIKFAQIASNRPDLLPDELIRELEKFQDHAIPIAEDNIRPVLENELGMGYEKRFEHIDYKPIASASIAQVHRARLHGGAEVVLKIQRPGIHDTVELDINILMRLALLIEKKFPQYASYQPAELVKMFEKSIKKELDFTIEASNMKRFGAYFKDNGQIYVPTVYPEFSTDKVLCMEYIDGIKCTNLKELETIGLSGKELALTGINLYFEQVFEHGFFHADPHPGNIFVKRDKKVCFIDYGMMGTVVDSDKRLLADLLLAVHDQDVHGLKKALLRFSWDETNINEKNLEYDIIEFFQNYQHVGLEEIDTNEVMAALNSLFFDYKIKVPGNLLLLLKALVIIEGVGLMLDPKYDIIQNIQPYVHKLLEKKYSPKVVSKWAMRSFGEFTRLATSLPEDTQDLIKKLKKGKLHIEFEHKGLEGLTDMLGVLSKRIAFSIIVGSMILGSSLLVMANIPPYYKGIPALGFFGFLLAGFMGLRLLISMLKHGKF
jgi:ubiquinone biosynthesis protein